LTEFSKIDQVLEAGIPRVTPAAVLCVWQGNQVIYEQAYGSLWIGPDAPPATRETLFDLASITKVFTATLFLQLVEQGVVGLDTPVVKVLPELAGVRPLGGFEHPLTGEIITYPYPQQDIDTRQVTFRHLLTHTSGLADWLPLYRQPNRQAALCMIYSHPFAYPPGAQSAYSDLGLILLGEAISRLAGQPLDQALAQNLLEPLGLKSIHYRRVPDDGSPPAEQASGRNIAATEICRWRKRRLHGEVDDENTGRLGGVSGHAGLFGTARDVAALGQLYLNGGVSGGKRLLQETTVWEATRYQAGDPTPPRGLGWMLRPQVEAPAGFTWAGAAFSPNAFGHTGFTGGSLWVDPARALVYVLLTNRVYHGREPGHQAIAELQNACSRAVVAGVDEHRTTL
jgi:CubicO group peptidase (beta-lactamase class C family)